MDALADFFPHLLVFAALLLAAIALTPAVESVGLPGPAAFLAVGVIAGYLEVVPTDRLGELPLEQIGVVGLYAILFQGGLATGFAAWRKRGRADPCSRHRWNRRDGRAARRLRALPAGFRVDTRRARRRRSQPD